MGILRKLKSKFKFLNEKYGTLFFLVTGLIIVYFGTFEKRYEEKRHWQERVVCLERSVDSLKDDKSTRLFERNVNNESN